VRAREEARDAFRIHDERAHALPRILGRCEIGRVETDPTCAVPLYERARRVERLPARIARGAVVEHSAIRGPRPRPIQRLAEAARIGVVSPRHQVAGGPPRTAVEPTSAGGTAVVAQLPEAGELLARAAYDLARLLGIDEIDERSAGVFLRQFLGRGIVRARVAPGQIEDRIGERSAFCFVELA